MVKVSRNRGKMFKQLCCCSVDKSCLTLQPDELQHTKLLCPRVFSRQENWSGLPCSPPGDLPNPGIKPRSPKLQADPLPSESSREPTTSQCLLRFISIESVMPSNHLVLCHPLFLPPSIFPSIRVFSTESVLHFRWPKYWSFSFSISPSDEYSGLISFRIDWLDLLARVFSNTTVQKPQFFGAQLSLQSYFSHPY